MATGHDGGTVTEARIDGDDVADDIHRERQAEVAHPAHHQVAPVAVLVGQGQAAVPAVAGLADLGEGLQAAQEPVDVDPQVTRTAARRIAHVPMLIDTPGGVNDPTGEPTIGAAMGIVHIEFFVEPFSEGSPGPHVEAAVTAFEDRGFATEVGPFATTAAGDPEQLAEAVAVMIRDAMRAGATRIALRLERPGPERPDAAPQSGDG